MAAGPLADSTLTDQPPRLRPLPLQDVHRRADDQQAALRGGLDQLVGLRQRGRQRLLGDQVLPGGQYAQ
jgi:hypothetical protein